MAGKRYAPEIKTAVLELGANGATYAQIREKFPIPKSTLSVWFNGVNKGRGKDKAYMAAHLTRAREAAHKVIRGNKEARLAEAITRAQQAMCGISLSNTDILKGLVAMLYWAEGAKGDGAATFANTDPLLASFYLGLLRKSYTIDEKRLRVRLHLHHYHRHRVAIDYWSKLLRVPKSQFGKIYVKKRSTRKRFRRNFQGICFIIYHDSSVRRELLALGRLLAERFMRP